MATVSGILTFKKEEPKPPVFLLTHSPVVGGCTRLRVLLLLFDFVGGACVSLQGTYVWLPNYLIQKQVGAFISSFSQFVLIAACSCSN